MPPDHDTPFDVTAPDSTPAGPAVDDDGRLAESLPCRACGYDLNGIAVAGTCPECATPVGRSIRGDLLRYCDPAWLERLARGLLMVVCSIVAGIVLQILFMLFGMFAGAAAAWIGGTAANAVTLVTVGGGLLTAVITLVNVIGAWFVTTQDPGRTETESPISLRTVARFAILVSLVSAPMQMVMGQSGMFGGGGGGGGLGMIDSAIIVLAFGASVCAAVGWTAFYLYVRRVALRVPLMTMARLLRIVAWGYAISTAVTMIGGFGSMIMLATGRLTTTGGTPVLAIGLGFGTCFSMLAFMIFQLWAAWLFLRLRKRMLEMVAGE